MYLLNLKFFLFPASGISERLFDWGSFHLARLFHRCYVPDFAALLVTSSRTYRTLLFLGYSSPQHRSRLLFVSVTGYYPGVVRLCFLETRFVELHSDCKYIQPRTVKRLATWKSFLTVKKQSEFPNSKRASTWISKLDWQASTVRKNEHARSFSCLYLILSVAATA